MKFAPYGLIMVCLLMGCAPGNEQADEQEIRRQLEEFLPKVVHKFVKEMGSPRERWEQDWATSELLAMIETENLRGDAYYEELRKGPPPVAEMKPLTPRSWWLPIPAEGTVSFQIAQVQVTDGGRGRAAVDFTNHEYSGESYPVEFPVVYMMKWEDGAWRIDDVLHGEDEEYSLRDFLMRAEFMSEGAE